DPGERLQRAGARTRIEPLPVAGLADVEWRGDVHEDEATVRLDHRAHFAAHGVVRRDRRADRDPPVMGDLGRDEADASNVEVTIATREAELGRQVPANDVAVEDGHAAFG